MKELVELYEANEALYNVRLKVYSDRDVQASTLAEMGEKLGKPGKIYDSFTMCEKHTQYA